MNEYAFFLKDNSKSVVFIPAELGETKPPSWANKKRDEIVSRMRVVRARWNTLIVWSILIPCFLLGVILIGVASMFASNGVMLSLPFGVCVFLFYLELCDKYPTKWYKVTINHHGKTYRY